MFGTFLTSARLTTMDMFPKPIFMRPPFRIFSLKSFSSTFLILSKWSILQTALYAIGIVLNNKLAPVKLFFTCIIIGIVLFCTQITIKK